MAGWAAIESVSLTMRDVIQRHVDGQLPPAGTVQVRLVTPAAFETLSSTTAPTISVFLYRLEENRETRNQLPRRDASGNNLPPTLNLDLWYLVTAWAARPATATPATEELAAREEHRLFGIVVQALAAAAELGAAQLVDTSTPPVFAAEDGVQISLESLPTEEHYRIWDASELAYRLSLTYRVRLIGIDPLAATAIPPVSEARFLYGEPT